MPIPRPAIAPVLTIASGAGNEEEVLFVGAQMLVDKRREIPVLVFEMAG